MFYTCHLISSNHFIINDSNELGISLKIIEVNHDGIMTCDDFLNLALDFFDKIPYEYKKSVISQQIGHYIDYIFKNCAIFTDNYKNFIEKTQKLDNLEFYHEPDKIFLVEKE